MGGRGERERERGKGRSAGQQAGISSISKV
jgi:hypothetical protein